MANCGMVIGNKFKKKDMKKLNGFESYLVLEGLACMRRQMKMDILEIQSEGKNPIMTTGYVDMVVDEAIEKIKSLTLKQK